MRELYSVPLGSTASETLATSTWEDAAHLTTETLVASLTIVNESTANTLSVRFGTTGAVKRIKAGGWNELAIDGPMLITAAKKLQVSGTAGETYRVHYQTFQS